MSSSVTSIAPLARWRRAIAPALVLLWVLAALPGIRSLLAFESTPGRQAAAALHWPARLLSGQNAGLPTLIVVLHPRCTCSQATLEELAEASREFDRPYNAIFLIDQPHASGFQWEKVSFYRAAQKALHARVVLDEDGHLGASFGALTSGEVFLYSAEAGSSARSLLFAGGVTPGRGMLGSNQGIEGLKLAFKGQGQAKQTPVFGCALASLAQDRGRS